jgi:chromosome segregation ATPase
MFENKIKISEHNEIVAEKDLAIISLTDKVADISAELTVAVADLEAAQKEINQLNLAKTSLETLMDAKEAVLVELNAKMANYSSAEANATSEGDKENEEVEASYLTSFDLEVRKMKS